jgi:putative transposase
MANTVGVSKSSISRQVIEASSKQMEELLERRWDGVELLVLYIDGMCFGEHHVISAVGVDMEGCKHVLGIQLGSDGECGGGEGSADPSARARIEDGPEISVRH